MFELIKELWLFVKEDRKLWLVPLIVALLVVGSVLILAQGSAVAPFIYTLF